MHYFCRNQAYTIFDLSQYTHVEARELHCLHPWQYLRKQAQDIDREVVLHAARPRMVVQVDTQIGGKLQQLAKSSATNLRCLSSEALKKDFYSIIPSQWINRQEVKLTGSSGQPSSAASNKHDF